MVFIFRCEINGKLYSQILQFTDVHKLEIEQSNFARAFCYIKIKNNLKIRIKAFNKKLRISAKGRRKYIINGNNYANLLRRLTFKLEWFSNGNTTKFKLNTSTKVPKQSIKIIIICIKIG